MRSTGGPVGAGSSGPGGRSASKTRRDVRESSSRNRTLPSRTPAYTLAPSPDPVTASGPRARFSDRNASAAAVETPPRSSAAATIDLRDCAAPALRSRALALRMSMSSAGRLVDPSFAVMGLPPSTRPELPEHPAQHDDRRDAGEQDRQHEVTG